MSGNVNILISGSREGFSYFEFKKKLSEFFKPETISLMIFGCAKGVDSHALRFAKEFDIPFRRFKADWVGLGKKAGTVRNVAMFENLLTVEGRRVVCAFRNDMSRGTTHMVKLSTDSRVELYLVDKYSGGVEFD